ncbi:acyltransferase domain-containing protein [Cystobacter fuscus]|uniref:type I polyketide synthase n=1 Tax=Cystobacter fuscus TaxID=43 RepID=UPI002B2C9C25|nr:acyltransferase domain-containing protein [Cystobacter fuscus]
MTDIAYEDNDQSRYIAVTGMAGRFPGAASVKQFWRNLCQGIESISVLGDQRDPAHPEYVPAYGVLEGAAEFDAEFFGYSPNDALILDPQHRLVLECAHEALESAGYGGSSRPVTGVFVGGSGTNYAEHVRARLDQLPFVDEWQLRQSTAVDFLSSRIAYQLGLTGPAVTVQTACSTSLVAVHVAIQALLAGDCDMAIAGGASVIASLPRMRYTPGGIVAPDGHCRTFDAASAGTVSASAVGLVVLRPLADALASGDHIHAVIRGSAINNDGRGKIGFTAPSVSGQVGVVRAAHEVAGVHSDEIGYVEAHGTATALGDPIEVAALTKAFGAGTGSRDRCWIGSVKTNIGHADAAAGVVGLIKTVLAVEHGVLPPSLHFERPNPAIDFASSPFEVNTRLREWGTPGHPRIAGVNALGVGGTNAHAVVAQAPTAPEVSEGRSHQLLVLSARTPSGVETAARQLADHLMAHPDVNLADVAWTLQTGRTAYPHRRFVVCSDPSEAVAALRGGSLEGNIAKTASPAPVFMFPGQGGQHVGMAASLYRQEPEFRRGLDQIAELAGPSLGLDLRDVLFPEGERQRDLAGQRLDTIAVSQPAVFAVQYAMAQLLMSWRLRPSAVVGHSLGAYAAACVAGVFSPADAVKLVVERGRLLSLVPAGGMAAVRLSEAELTPLLPGGLSVGAVNGPRQCTVTGPVDLVVRFVRELTERSIEARVLRIATAGHSSLVEPILDRFAEVIAGLRLNRPALPMLSDTTGTWADPDTLRTVDYWVAHLRQPIRFGEALSTLLATENRVLVDVGPGRTLQTLTRQHPAFEDRHVVVNVLPHPVDAVSDLGTALAALGKLWAGGANVDLTALHAGERRRRTPLPTYPFERRRYLVPPPEHARPTASGSTPASWIGAKAQGTPEAGTPRDNQPHAPVLAAVLMAFSKALGVPDIEAQDSFFDLGGDSLIATKVASWARTEFAVTVTAADILRGRNAATLAAVIAKRREGAAPTLQGINP